MDHKVRENRGDGDDDDDDDLMSGLPLRVSDEVIWITKYERKLMTSPHAETARNSR